MNLVPNWRDVVKHAWSVRFILLAVILSVIEAILPFLGLPISPGFLSVLAAVSGLLAGFARIVAQNRLGGHRDPDWESGE